MSDSETHPQLSDNREYQVGETESGEAIMGKDRSIVGAGDDFSAFANVGAPSSAAATDDSDRAAHAEDAEAAAAAVAAAAEDDSGNPPPAPPTPRAGADSTSAAPAKSKDDGSRGSSRTPSVAAATMATTTMTTNKRRESRAPPPPDNDSASSSVDQLPMSSPVALPPLSILTSSHPHNSNNGRKRSDSPMRTTPQDEGLTGMNKSPSNNNNIINNNNRTNSLTNNNFRPPSEGSDEEASADGALVAPAPLQPVAVPGVSQRHLYQLDKEYEDALSAYDADVMSSEAASRFAVGIHSTAAAATRHFADFCELSTEEANRLVDRRNKKADSVRNMIRSELTRYGFAGVAQELSQMTGVLIDDHRRRADLLCDRVRMQLKSTLSSILREQEHAGEALRAEFVRTASVEFAQDSLLELIGIAPDSEEQKKRRLEREMMEAADQRTTAAAAAAGMRSPSQAQREGKKATNEVYANELQKRLSAIFDRQTGFAVRKAESAVASARANFTRLADQLAKIEDDNIRRLLTTRERTEKHISDLEMLKASSARNNILEESELETDLRQMADDLKRLRAAKDEAKKELLEREADRREKRKTSYGMTVGGLMMGGGALDHLLGSSSPSGRGQTPNNNPNESSGVYNLSTKSKLDREMDDKLKSAAARSKALAEKNATRLQASRDRVASRASAAKSKDMSFGRRAGQASNNNNNNNNSGSLSQGQLRGAGELTSAEKTRRHVMGDGPSLEALSRLETREVDPKEAVLLRNRRSAGGAGDFRQGSSPRHGVDNSAWVESEALRAIAMRTARHGISFPDGSDPVIPTHKFLDEELAAIYELRHLRSPGSTTTASRAQAVAAAERKHQQQQQQQQGAAESSRYY